MAVLDHHQEFFFQCLKLSLIYLVVAFLLKVVKQLWWQPWRIEKHFSKQGIKGPPYKLFIGNAKDMEKMMKEAASQPIPPLSHNILPRVLSFYHYWKKLYGTIFLIWFGPTARLVVSDPDLIREILTKSEFYEKVEPHPLVRQLEGNGILELKGEKWALHRKIIAPSFLMENLKMLVPDVSKSVIDMIDKWDAKINCGGEEDQVEIEAFDAFQTLLEDVISRAAFGISHEEGKAIYQLQAQQMLLAALAFQKVFIPGYRFLPTKLNIKSWRLEREVKKSLRKLINGRKSTKLVSDEAPKDLLGLMIEASSSSASNISVSDIIEECKGFFFAGKETTSSLLTWTTVLLAMHPRWQELARDEVLSVCGPRPRVPTKDDLGKLKNLNMIVNEALRLYSPTVATIRSVKADTRLGGYMIPQGMELLIPILGIHHDQAVWGPDATEFKPDRFSTDQTKARNRRPFLPFGLGIRNCIGQNLAILQVKVTIALILQRFTFRLSPSYMHAPTVLLMLYPQYGAQIIFKKLLNNEPKGSGSQHHQALISEDSK